MNAFGGRGAFGVISSGSGTIVNPQGLEVGFIWMVILSVSSVIATFAVMNLLGSDQLWKGRTKNGWQTWNERQGCRFHGYQEDSWCSWACLLRKHDHAAWGKPVAPRPVRVIFFARSWDRSSSQKIPMLASRLINENFGIDSSNRLKKRRKDSHAEEISWWNLWNDTWWLTGSKGKVSLKRVVLFVINGLPGS